MAIKNLNNAVILAKAGEWQGLYVNGKLAFEDYRIDFEQGLVELFKANIRLAEGMGFEARVVDSKWDSEVLSESGFPKEIKDVKFSS